MIERKRGDAERARRILRRLAGSSESLDEREGALDDSGIADRLQQIEQLFQLHGGERRDSDAPDARQVLFEWGHLQVVDSLGQGSFGEVYRAYDQTLDREVALKLLKVAEGRPFQSQLFLHEARQLALVRHRNVLAVHGAAVHDGRPGLWTDLIDGVALNDTALLESGLPLGEALNLVDSLATGLQAVHGAGLVHGDVKPANIMQDRSGDWILMDFGASLEGRHAAVGSVMTSGTPLYMAPEVVRGDPPSAASDIYSMGATLYRALTGFLPVEADDWASLKAAHGAGHRPDTGLARGRVDGRIMRLIEEMTEPEPGRRPDADAIIDRVRDIREAPQRRFRVAALSSIGLLLVLGLTLTSIGFYRANDARMVAEREQRNTEAVNEFLQRVLASPSTTGRAGDMTVEEMLLQASEDVAPELADQPTARVVVHRVLAESFNTLRLSDQARAQIAIAREAMATLSKPLPEIDRGLTLQAARAAENEGSNEESLAIVTAFADEYAPVLGDGNWQVRWARKMMVTNLFSLSRFDEAEVLLDAYFSEVPDPETANTHFGYEILQSRANLLSMQGRYEEAVGASERALNWLDRYPRERPNNRLSALTNLALSLTRAGQPARSIEVLQSMLPLQERMYGVGSSEYLGTLVNLSAAQRESGDPSASGRTLTRAREVIQAHPDAIPFEHQLAVSMNLANVLNATGDQARGEALIRESIVQASELWSSEHVNVLKLEYNLAELMNQQGRFEEARALAAVTLEKKADALGDSHVFTLLTRDNLAVALGGLGRGAEALSMHERAYAGLQEQLGVEHPFTLLAARHRITAMQRFSPDAVAPDALEELLARHVNALGEEHPDTIKARALLSP